MDWEWYGVDYNASSLYSNIENFMIKQPQSKDDYMKADQRYCMVTADEKSNRIIDGNNFKLNLNYKEHN